VKVIWAPPGLGPSCSVFRRLSDPAAGVFCIVGPGVTSCSYGTRCHQLIIWDPVSHWPLVFYYKKIFVVDVPLSVQIFIGPGCYLTSHSPLALLMHGMQLYVIVYCCAIITVQ